MDVPGALHYIICRGFDHRIIFRDNTARSSNALDSIRFLLFGCGIRRTGEILQQSLPYPKPAVTIV